MPVHGPRDPAATLHGTTRPAFACARPTNPRRTRIADSGTEMRRALALLVLAVSGIACDRLHALSEADFQVASALASTYLRYHVSSPRGEWPREFAVSRTDFAARRRTGGRP